jgi:hypothetical protein
LLRTINGAEFHFKTGVRCQNKHLTAPRRLDRGRRRRVDVPAQLQRKAEYLFYDLGTVTYINGPLVSFLNGTSSVNFINTSRSSVRFDGNIVRAGLNYHFNWGPPPVGPPPVVSKY